MSKLLNEDSRDVLCKLNRDRIIDNLNDFTNQVPGVWVLYGYSSKYAGGMDYKLESVKMLQMRF